MAIVLLAGCATLSSAGYPSLERRAIEQHLTDPEPTTSGLPTPRPISASLAAMLAGIDRDADSGQAAFAAALTDQQSTIDSGRHAPPGGEARVRAEQALTRVTSARGPTTVALAQLDRLAADAADRGDTEAAAAIALALNRVGALVDAQDATLARLSLD